MASDESDDNNKPGYNEGVINSISHEKIKHYFSITGEALEVALKAPFDDSKASLRNVVLDMASRYFSDAKHFFNNGNWVLAFAALNYAHGWLDAGARLKCFMVNDSRLFTVDDSFDNEQKNID